MSLVPRASRVMRGYILQRLLVIEFQVDALLIENPCLTLLLVTLVPCYDDLISGGRHIRSASKNAWAAESTSFQAELNSGGTTTRIAF
jgi:hypothetical protein